MNYGKWSKEIKKYQLSGELSIERTTPEEFAPYFATYVIFDKNIWFRQSFDISCQVVAECDSCFFIYDKGTRIGGVLIEPNYMNCIFLIPPYTDYERVLLRLKGLLVFWSDESKEIIFGGAKAHELNMLQRLGFRAGEARRCMIRPTESFEIEWEDSHLVLQPDTSNIEEIAELFHQAFSGGAGYSGKMTAEEHLESVTAYFKRNSDNELLRSASTLVYDKATKELLGACLVSLWEGWPNIYDIAVKPSYKGRGIARKMLKTAIDRLHKEYPVLRLFVTLGNDAELLYHKMGFLAGVETTEMYLPAKK